MIKREFPSTRMRRLRQSEVVRNLVSENHLNTNDLIQPLFFTNTPEQSEAIDSMPGIFRHNLDGIKRELEDLVTAGIKSVAIFPVIDSDQKDEVGTYAINENNFFYAGIKEIASSFPDLVLITDVALDPYTSHGHDGIVIDDKIANDKTIEVLTHQSLLLADAGSTIIAPSDMMDGRIGVIRSYLDNHGHEDIVILSYAAKYASYFYGPFRDAVGSSTNLGKTNKKTYQMNYANIDEAIQETALDIQEGADIVMVKPGLAYLDVLKTIKEHFRIPTFAYQVSGEYSMLVNAINKGWLDKNVMLESLICFKRAGADAILTYAAKSIALEMNK
tara:strand:- start:7770 stop:8762 length:993 start_codon:yes stop_codon:yes gene_type:complete